MRYVISRSQDQNEINRYFMSDVLPRIGTAFEHGGHVYRVLDIECVVRDDQRCSEVRGKVARVM